MIDLRSEDKDLIRSATRSNFKKYRDIRTKPDFVQQNNFHIALADYLHKEFKKRKLQTNKLNDLAVRIHIGEPELYKYHSLVIDCLDGNIYVISKNNKERKVGKLLSFTGSRASDAYHCMARSIYKILRKISVYTMDHQGNKVYENSALIVKADLRTRVIVSDLRKKIDRKDLRKVASVTDLRKKSISKTAVDLRNKKKMGKFETAIAIICDLRQSKQQLSYITEDKPSSFKNVVSFFKRLLKF